MIKLISAALVLTVLTVPVSMSNLGGSDESAAAEFQPQAESSQERALPANGQQQFQSFDNPATVRLADFSGNSPVQDSGPSGEAGNELRPQFENTSRLPMANQPQQGLTPITVNSPQDAGGFQNSLREIPSTASWQQPQFQPPANAGPESDFEKRFRSDESVTTIPQGNPRMESPRLESAPAASYEDPRYSSANTAPIQDRSVVQAAWPQQPGGGTFNPASQQSAQPMQPMRPVGQSGMMTGPDPSAAKNVLEQLEQFSQSQAMQGTPLAMEEALHQTPPDLRSRMVAAYWQAWRDRFLLTSSEQKFHQVHELDQSGAFGPAGSLARQLRNAEADMVSRKLALRRSQTELKQFFPALHAAEYLPLPVDVPVTAGYETHYDWYVANGRGNAELQLLDDSMPMVLELVLEQSDSAMRAMHSAERMLQMSINGQATLDQALATLDRAQQTTGDCLESLRQYNATIGDYSISLRPDVVSSFELAKMLVPARRTTSVNLASQPARTADLRVNVPAQPLGAQQPVSNGGFHPSSGSQNFGDASSGFDPTGSGGTFQPMSLPGSGNTGPVAPAQTSNGATPITLQPIGPTGQSGFNPPAGDATGNPANQQLVPRTFQNPGQQIPPGQSFGSGG